jgi:hypothetical protein
MDSGSNISVRLLKRQAKRNSECSAAAMFTGENKVRLRHKHSKPEILIVERDTVTATGLSDKDAMV